MLYGLSQEQLAHTLFPLQDREKEEVRRLAKEAGLPVADKGDSMEICFVPGDDYIAFLEAEAGQPMRPGNFVDENGRVLGRPCRAAAVYGGTAQGPRDFFWTAYVCGCPGCLAQ